MEDSIKEEMDQELYDSILASLLKYRHVVTEEDAQFIQDLALEATEGAVDFFNELKEAVWHQRATIKRLIGKNVS